MGAIEEIERGITNRFLITPVSRAAIMNASVITNGVSIALQSAIIVVLGWAGGARYPGGIGGVAGLIATAVPLRTGFRAPFHPPGVNPRPRANLIPLGTFLLLPPTLFFPALLCPNPLAHRSPP